MHKLLHFTVCCKCVAVLTCEQMEAVSLVGLGLFSGQSKIFQGKIESTMENKASESVADLSGSALNGCSAVDKSIYVSREPGGFVDMKSTGTVSRVTRFQLVSLHFKCY